MTAAPRLRRRLSRTLSRARWREYRRLLEAAREHGYGIRSLEDWIDEPGGRDERVLVLRHDVDQHPRSALRMARVERRLGVTSTWYFRWRTADPRVIAALRAEGHAIGLHYEPLTRRALELGLVHAGESTVLLEEAREALRAEIAAFAGRFGPIRSACPHGDSRVPGVSNAPLLRGEDPARYGIAFDGNEAMRRRRLGHWLTDRSAAEGGWGDGADPHRLLRDGVTPILVLTHPNNWASGPALWLDRLLAALLRAPRPARPARPLRTRGDAPPSTP